LLVFVRRINLIRFENVSKSYGRTAVLKEISFAVAAGTFTVLVGPSGCGKTTTLKTINRLIDIDKGKIFVDEEDITGKDKVALRRSIGYVIQQIGLFPNMTIEENVCVVPKLLGFDKASCRQITQEMLELVEMPYEEYAHKYPSQLSGGQQQRVGVLRALAASPPIVLMDEPFSALDPMTRLVLQDEVRRLQQKLNKTIVFVTHDMDEALSMADTIIFMDQGRIIQMASPEEMLKNPANDLVRSFLKKQSQAGQQAIRTAGDIMRTGVITAKSSRGVRESVELIRRHKIDSLIVTDLEGHYEGVVSIAGIRRGGKEHEVIRSLLEHDHPFSYVDEDAQLSYNKLMDGPANYVVVLNRDQTVAGIITKSSLAQMMAEAIWGDNGD
jgi:osmoprotectant transport system ATP-binding protein